MTTQRSNRFDEALYALLKRRVARVGALLVAAVSMGACTRYVPMVFPTSATDPEKTDRRRPPGIAVDPVPELPDEKRAADTDNELVVLEQPADLQQARQTVDAFFEAVIGEAPERLESLLVDNARLRSSRRGRRELAAVVWRRRLQELDYGSAGGQLLYKPSEVEVYRAAELDTLRPARSLPLAGKGDDVLIVVPMEAPEVSGVRLFGDEIVFLLARDEHGYAIEEIFEDFRLP